MHDKLNN